MVDNILKSDEGISHDVFLEPAPEEEEMIDPETGEPIPRPIETDILKTFKQYKYVPEVVREQRMHYYRVPRLGCFMAVPLVYNSCLF